MGTGDVPGSGTFPYANAQWVFDENYFASRPATRDAFVAWPPKGYSPFQLMPQRWSFSYPGADFSTATVIMQKDGVNVLVQLEPVSNGAGENTIVWLPAGLPPSAPAADLTYTVNINNVRIHGTPQNFSYSATIFNPATTPPPPAPSACPTLSASSIAPGWEGQASAISISAAANCSWIASSTVPWVQVYPLSGTGNGTLQYTVFPNFNSTPRFASITMNSSVVTVQQVANPGSANERFAELLYFNYLGRLPSPAEARLQATVLNGGRSRGDMAYDFFQTPEFNLGGRFVAGLYVGLLNRDAEYSGWLFQRNALATNLTNPSLLVSSFLGSAEYRLKFGEPTNTDFVRMLYRYILLREPGPAEVSLQVGALAGGVTRTQLASSFLNSPEFRSGTGPRLFAFLLYATLLQRDSTFAERNELAARLQSGISLTAAIGELLATSEHLSLLQ
jgi:hypothetical protein